jgi:hypothetical protein
MLSFLNPLNQRARLKLSLRYNALLIMGSDEHAVGLWFHLWTLPVPVPVPAPAPVMITGDKNLYNVATCQLIFHHGHERINATYLTVIRRCYTQGVH